jgi:hypothetical protein
MEDSVTLEQLVREFESAEDATVDARRNAERCQDYFDDKQLTAEEEATLKKRGQPAVVFNEIKPKVKTMLGLEKQTRKDPKAFPRNPQDEDVARAATDAIRFVCDDSNWDDVRSKAAKNIAIQGTGVVFVGVKQTRAGYDPDIRRISWDRFYYDPHSAEDDFEDAKFKGIVVWMDLDDAVALYPDGKDALTDTWRQAQGSETYDDKPKWNMWADHKRRRVRVCEHYYRDAEGWKFCIFTKAGFVVEPQPSPYLGDDDQPECPIKAISLYVDRDNNRYGEVQAMISPQDEINKRRSKSLHTVNTRQVRVSPNVAQNADDVRKELSKPDGVFIGEAGDVEILQTSDMLMGNLNLMVDARDHIHRTGVNSAMAGKDTGGQSGKAIALQQMGGMTEAADYLDAIRRLSLMVYRSVWCRIRQFWKEERWIRVTDNEMNVRFVGLNRPVTMLEAAAKQMGVTEETMPQMMQAAQQGDPQAAQMLAQLQALKANPQSQMPVAYENSVTELDVDIVVDEGVDTPTIQAEQFDVVAKMLPGAPPNLQPILWEALLANSAFKDKEKALEALRQPPDPAMMQQQELAMAGAQAQVEETQSKTVLNYAKAEETQASVALNAMQAGMQSVNAPA